VQTGGTGQNPHLMAGCFKIFCYLGAPQLISSYIVRRVKIANDQNLQFLLLTSGIFHQFKGTLYPYLNGDDSRGHDLEGNTGNSAMRLRKNLSLLSHTNTPTEVSRDVNINSA
jgi:hypothetical protein